MQDPETNNAPAPAYAVGFFWKGVIKKGMSRLVSKVSQARRCTAIMIPPRISCKCVVSLSWIQVK